MHTICRDPPHQKHTRYSGFQDLLGVTCLSLQRLGSPLWFGTGTRMAPMKNLRVFGFHPRNAGYSRACKEQMSFSA